MGYKVAVAGSTGFIGKEVTAHLEAQGHNVLPIVRNDFSRSTQNLAEMLENCEVIINLAGAPIIARWSKKSKEKIYQSRIGTTKKLAEAICLLKNKPMLFLCGSAIGIYDDVALHDEESKDLKNDFIGQLVRDWEIAADSANACTTRVVKMRIGIVLGERGGALGKILLPFRMGFGGRIGSGNQWMSFIHIKDMLAAMEHIMENPAMKGVVNMTAPEIIRSLGFTREVAKALNRPHLLGTPSFALRLLFGEGASVLTGGQAAKPGKLIASGFTYRYPDIKSTVKDLTGKHK